MLASSPRCTGRWPGSVHKGRESRLARSRTMTNVNTAIVVELDKPPDASLALSLAEEAPFWFDDGAVATVVLHVDESSPAFGLLLQGDVILSVNGTEVTDARQAAELIHNAVRTAASNPLPLPCPSLEPSSMPRVKAASC